MSASEVCYYIFGYNLDVNLPNVLRLAVHLENQKPVYFCEDAELKDVMNFQRHTTLAERFFSNLSLHSAREETNTNFLITFCGYNYEHKWFGRIHAEGKRFYLLVIANHVIGCVIFQNIQTLADGTVCESYKEAAYSLGLLEDVRSRMSV